MTPSEEAKSTISLCNIMYPRITSDTMINCQLRISRRKAPCRRSQDYSRREITNQNIQLGLTILDQSMRRAELDRSIHMTWDCMQHLHRRATMTPCQRRFMKKSEVKHPSLERVLSTNLDLCSRRRSTNLIIQHGSTILGQLTKP